MGKILLVSEISGAAGALNRLLRESGIQVFQASHRAVQEGSVEMEGVCIAICDTHGGIVSLQTAELLREHGYAGWLLFVGCIGDRRWKRVNDLIRRRTVDGYLVIPSTSSRVRAVVGRLLNFPRPAPT